MNLNKVFLAGNLTRDPELRYLPNGKAVVNFGIAVNRKWKTEGGESKEEVTFIDLAAFGKTAEVIGQYFKKGKPIFIEGRLKLEQWDDKQGGGKRSKLSVTVESFQFCGGDREHGQAQAAQPSQPAQTDNSGSKIPIEEDDVPF